MWERRGQLSRESEVFVVVRVYCFARRFYVANQASTTCRLRLELSVETSTPPFLGGRKVAGHFRIARVRFERWKLSPAQWGCLWRATRNVQHSTFKVRGIVFSGECVSLKNDREGSRDGEAAWALSASASCSPRGSGGALAAQTGGEGAAGATCAGNQASMPRPRSCEASGAVSRFFSRLFDVATRILLTKANDYRFDGRNNQHSTSRHTKFPLRWRACIRPMPFPVCALLTPPARARCIPRRDFRFRPGNARRAPIVELGALFTRCITQRSLDLGVSQCDCRMAGPLCESLAV